MNDAQHGRVTIEDVRPSIDCGRFPVKRIAGQTVTVEAGIFADGHDQLSCDVLFRRADASTWQSSPMASLGNDMWRGSFTVEAIGEYEYTVRARVDVADETAEASGIRHGYRGRPCHRGAAPGECGR